MFDWRELKRWGIPESRLPPGSVVQYRGPTLWDEHKVTVFTAVGALVLQSFLIALLLYERRARHRAEIESRRNLTLATDANRRETISALTASIGHELGQPLTAIAHNTQTLQLMVTADRRHPTRQRRYWPISTRNPCSPRRSSNAIVRCSAVINRIRSRSTSTP